MSDGDSGILLIGLIAPFSCCDGRSPGSQTFR